MILLVPDLIDARGFAECLFMLYLVRDRILFMWNIFYGLFCVVRLGDWGESALGLG
jgi:hypothetical protein